jgi:hypothetical protein
LTSKKLCFFFLTMDEGLDHSSTIVFPSHTDGEVILEVMKISTMRHMKVTTIPGVRYYGRARDGLRNHYIQHLERQTGRFDKHSQLAVSPTCSVFSPFNPMPPVQNSLPLMMINPSSKTEEWMNRAMPVEEVSKAYSLSEPMHENASTALESEFAAVISATAPLNLMNHVFEDIYFHMLEDISKAGGERGAVDTDETEVKRMFEWQYIRRNCSE